MQLASPESFHLNPYRHCLYPHASFTLVSLALLERKTMAVAFEGLKNDSKEIYIWDLSDENNKKTISLENVTRLELKYNQSLFFNADGTLGNVEKSGDDDYINFFDLHHRIESWDLKTDKVLTMGQINPSKVSMSILDLTVGVSTRDLETERHGHNQCFF